MSWSGGGEIFDAVMKRLVELNVGWYPTQEIAVALFDVLDNRGWDTQEESLGLLHGQPGAAPIVSMFNMLGYVADGQYDDKGHSTVRVPCGYCKQLVAYFRDEDTEPVIETHVLDVEARPQFVCPYSGKGRTGF